MKVPGKHRNPLLLLLLVRGNVEMLKCGKC